MPKSTLWRAPIQRKGLAVIKQGKKYLYLQLGGKSWESDDKGVWDAVDESVQRGCWEGEGVG